MQTMTSLSIKEAIVMRVITVVTLIFLPATFVSVSCSEQSHFEKASADNSRLSLVQIL